MDAVGQKGEGTMGWWRKSFGPAIAFAKLSQRRQLRLDNPFLDGISFDYRPYFYNPQTDRFGDY